MILKFRWNKKNRWVYKDNIRQVKTGECRFHTGDEKTEASPGTTPSFSPADVVDIGGGKTAVPMEVLIGNDGEVMGNVVDWDWIPDEVRLGGVHPKHKFITVEYGKASGWHTESQTLIFHISARVYLLNDQGQTVEIL